MKPFFDSLPSRRRAFVFGAGFVAFTIAVIFAVKAVREAQPIGRGEIAGLLVVVPFELITALLMMAPFIMIGGGVAVLLVELARRLARRMS